MIAIFDMEGVLIDGEFLPELAKRVGKEKEVTELTIKGIAGEISWEEGILKRIDLVKGANYEDCVEISKNMQFMKGAKETCNELKKMGFTIAVVSGGFDLLSDRLTKELNLDYMFSNTITFKNNSIDSIIMNVNSDKAKVIKPILDQLKEKMSNIVATVDGANDLKLLDIAGLKIAFNAKPVVQEHADVMINQKDLTLILPHIKKKFESLKNHY